MSRDRVELLLGIREHSWNKEEWFVPLAGALSGVGPAEAAWQPPGGGNTIWQTVHHITYYNERLLSRLTGAPRPPALPDNDATFGEPGNAQDASGWQALVERTHRVGDGMGKALGELSDTDLATPYGSSTLGDELGRWIGHDAFHTGQIILIRKMQGSWPARR